MNIVFWLLVVIVLAFIWLCLSFAFNGIGGIVLKLFNDAKSKIESDKLSKTKECEDDASNEKG